MILWPRRSPRYDLGSLPVHGLRRTIALTTAEGSHKLHGRAAAVHHSAPVLRGSYRRCAAGSSPGAPGSITATAGAGLALPWVQPFRIACNFDMNKHNMYDYLEICGWMVGDEKEWRAWKSGL